MKLNNIYGYGQLFGYSAIDGINHYKNDFIGVLTSNKIEIKFEIKPWVKISFDYPKDSFKAVMSDFIEADDFFIAFNSWNTLVGYSKNPPLIKGENKLLKIRNNNVDIYFNLTQVISVYTNKKGELFEFVIRYSNSISDAIKSTNLNGVDIEKIKKEKYDYYKNLPSCKDAKYEQLYYKALSVNKVNTHTPEGNIKCNWTTPDRIPHRHMWLWDSVFHSMALVNYNKEWAKDSIRAVLQSQREDGFIAHMIMPNKISNLTQPQVLAWGVYNVYLKTNDIDFLKECVDSLERYLNWNKLNRDENKNGLLEWHTKPHDIHCKCDESGQDNSIRFDFDNKMDAIDFSTFQANDAYYLSLIYKALNNKEKEKEWNDYYQFLKDKINNNMYDKETGTYYDLLFDGTLTKVLTPNSFFPLLANIPNKEQANKMVELLKENNKLWTTLPLATISKDHPLFSNDMWRGGVWLNINYFVIKGLLNYGYVELARELKDKTLEAVNKWYMKTGAIFEFYDPLNEIAPYYCVRKGKVLETPDYSKHMHSIIDFNWSACFTLLLIQEEI